MNKLEGLKLANVIGTKWGSSTLGTPGGTVTWSLAAAGENISRFGVETQTSTTGDTFLSYDFEQVIAEQFAEWSKYGDIEFEQIEDEGGAAGQGFNADIRIFFGAIPGGTAGYAFYPSSYGSAIGGDILIDTLSRFNTDPLLFAAIVLHEIGHALGLGHVSGDSIMTPNVKKIGLQPDDIAGIQEIYGVQDDPAPGPDPQPEPDPQPQPDPDPQPEPDTDPDPHHDHDHDHDHDPDTDPHEGPIVPDIQGDDGNNRLVGTADADVIDGAGGDDTILGGEGDDLLLGGEGRDTIRGDDGDDSLFGNDGRDKLMSGRGDDTIEGGSGNDVVKGGSGSDLLIGGTGNDNIKGGNDSDVFVFADGHGKDRVMDFNAGSDLERLDFSDLSSLNSFEDVMSVAYQKNDHVMIETGNDSWILLRRFDINDLNADDFIF